MFSTTYSSANVELPTARIANSHKNLLKNYDGKVYLNDGDEFIIELYNPTQSKVLAQIKLNGKSYSNTGLILRPGERIWLDRFLEEKRKFKFDTYEVGTSQRDNVAIELNGKVEIEFFYEDFNQYNTVVFTASSKTWEDKVQSPDWYKPFDTNGIYGSGIHGIALSGSITATGKTEVKDITFGGTTQCNYFSADCNFDARDYVLSNNVSNRKQETGRIEKGSKSKQEFVVSSDKFQTWCFHSVNMQILPQSKKPLEKRDIAVYCVKDGTKQKKGWVHCPNCGTKF